MNLRLNAKLAPAARVTWLSEPSPKRLNDGFSVIQLRVVQRMAEILAEIESSLVSYE
jgi:hypothetical protein